MKKIKLGLITLSTVLVVATAAFTISSFNQKEGGIEKRELLSNILVQSLDSYHYQPVTLDDEYSKTLFKQYVESLDYNKRILLQSDVDKLKEYELKLDEQVIAYSFDFFDLSYKILEERLEDIQKIYPKVLSKPVSLKSKETIELDSKKVNYPANKSELEKIWKNRLTYEVIAKVYSLEQEQIKAKEKSDTVTIKSLKELEVDARKKVLKNYNDWFRRLSKVEKKDRLATYMNSITTMYDPHTNFFPPKQKENFDISISGKLEGIGATLQEKDGYVKVIRIVPGSASWKQGDLKSGDLILKVGQADAEPVSIVDMRLDDAVKLIRGKKGSEVRLTIRKIDGEEKTISIIRDVVILEETYAKSAVITDSITGKKIGLINLPKFYADFSDAGTGRNCADDVKKEIIKLKGSNAALLLHQQGVKVKAISDISGAYWNDKGIDIGVALDYSRKNNWSLEGFTGAEKIPHEDLIVSNVDVLVPAAMEDVITSVNAPNIKARLIVEGANGPTSAKADQIIKDKGILVVPDILANAGGVTVSYFEWVQNRLGYRWSLDRVEVRADRIMTEAFDKIYETMEKYDVTMRIAAYIVSIDKVAQTFKLRGCY